MLVVTLAALGFACGPDPAVVPDVRDAGAEHDAGLDAGPRVIDIAYPAAPSLPELGPCPEGWAAEQTIARDVRVTTCAPVPSMGCSPGTIALPSGACVAVGRACPTGDFADVDDPAAVYVRPGATGTGTREAPLGTIAAALAREDAAHVILARGTYAEDLELTRPITIEGACASETILAPPLDEPAVVRVSAAGVVLRELSIDSGQPGILVSGEGAEATIEGLLITRTGGSAVRAADGARVSLERVGISGVSRRDLALRVAALFAERGGSITGRALEVRDVEASVLSRTGGRIDLEDASLSCRGEGCYASAVVLGAELRLARARIEGEASNALVVVEGEGARAELERSFVSVETGATLALEIAAGATLEGRGLHVRGASRVIEESGVGSHVDLSDLVLDRGPPAADGAYAVELLEGGASITRAVVIDMPTWVFRAGADSTLALTDVHVLERAGSTGMVLLATGAATRASVTRVAIRGVHGFGLHAADGAAITADDLEIDGLDVDAPEQRAFAAGLVAGPGGAITARRVHLRDIEGWGIAAIQASTIDVDDLSIEAPRLPDDREMYALGVLATSGSSVRLLRARMVDTIGYGLFAGGEGTRISATELAIDGVHPAEGAERPAGTGIVAVLGGSVEAARFTISGAQECGVRILPGATMALDLGMIRTSLIGACVQAEDAQVDRVLRTVRFQDNDSNLSAVALPLPRIPGVE